ncbi:glutathione S-transferase family protein [Alteromonadaceae bacterium M269]|nr:glutathione S-transferase family protein [Alteromonadaceae bacterium M269]
MKLYYTPRSHFSRKVRILLRAMEIDVELVDVGNVADGHDIFGSNPLMKVPTVVDGELDVFDSDHIAQYLVRKYTPDDKFSVFTTDVMELNARAVINGAMSAEVELLLAERTGLDTGKHQRFDKIKASIVNGLMWLESHADVFPEKPSYLGFHLVSMWDHLKLYGLVQLDYPQLKEKVERISKEPFVSESMPS